MIEGFVDSASLYEVLLALSRDAPRQSFRLEWDRALEVTASFISADQLKLPPSPQSESSASGLYGIMLAGLQNVIAPVKLPSELVSNSLIKTQKWAQRNNDDLLVTLERFIGSTSVEPESQSKLWLESHIENEWLEHAKRRGSLFENAFSKQISQVINVSQSEIDRIYSLCSNPEFVRSLVKKPNNADFELTRNAFIVSTLLRGKYYSLIAKETGRQILLHPIRELSTKGNYNSNSVKIDVSNFERHMANIVLASAYAEKRPDHRVALWVENISRMRQSRGRIAFDQRITDEIARDDAIHEAKRFGIRLHPKWIENGLDAAINFGCFTLTSFYLSPFAGFAVSGAMYGVTNRWKVGEKLASTATLNTLKLRSLSRSAPGRIGERSLILPSSTKR